MNVVLPAGSPDLSDAEFSQFRALVLQETGITLSTQKKALLIGRLGSRLRARGLGSFAQYYRLLRDPKEALELQTAIDLITTNETSFFRESDHFKILVDYIQSLRPLPSPFRVWSAASSSGEEAYTLAMVLSDCLRGAPWEIIGTDISSRVIERARQALYPMERARSIPQAFLKRFCLKGQGQYEGMFIIHRPLRDRVAFVQANLSNPLRQLGSFDVIFLRNVLIYFDAPQKHLVLTNVLARLKPSGLLIVGHSESLAGLSAVANAGLYMVRPTVYRLAQGG